MAHQKSESDVASTYKMTLDKLRKMAKRFSFSVENLQVTSEANNELSETLYATEKAKDAFIKEFSNGKNEILSDFTTQLLEESSENGKQSQVATFFFGKPKFSSKLSDLKISFIKKNRESIDLDIEHLSSIREIIKTITDTCQAQSYNLMDSPMTLFSCRWLEREYGELGDKIIKLHVMNQSHNEHIIAGTATISVFENLSDDLFCPYPTRL